MMLILVAKVNVLLAALTNVRGIIIQNFKEPKKTVAKFESSQTTQLNLDS
jgi:hypothetical protein